MKTVIIYYTFGGSTKKEAERLSAELEAPLYRVKEVRDRSLLASFVPAAIWLCIEKPWPFSPLTSV